MVYRLNQFCCSFCFIIFYIILKVFGREQSKVIGQNIFYISIGDSNSNIIKFKNKNKKEIVKNDISLLGILQNQTNSNFNNKYDLKYWTNNQKKKEQIKHCFTLIKKGINLNDIDNMLNGPKEITSYNIQTAPNIKIKKKIDNFSNLKKRIERKNNYNLTVNTLEKIRPLTTFKNIIK